MKKNHFKLALIFMAVFALLSWFTRDKSPKSDVAVGDIIFEDVAVDKISKILITSPQKVESTLYPKNKKWFLKERYDMEVDPAVMRNLMLILTKSEAIQVVPFEEKELDLFELDEQRTTTLKIFQQGSNNPLTFKFGKFHQFSQESQGRYVYIVEKKALVLLAGRYDFITGHHSVWLKKYLPHNDQVAAVTLYYDGAVLWRLARENSKMHFNMVEPQKVNIDKNNIQILVESAFYLRYMDIKPAMNDFKVDPEYKKVRLVYQTFAGRAYQLSFLKQEEQYLRCTIDILDAKVSSEFIKQYGTVEELREELSEWHFLVPMVAYKNLFNVD